MNEKLKPCPFCGGEAHIAKHSFYEKTTRSFSDKTFGVICEECYTSGWQFYKTQESAIEAWNRSVKG